MCVIIRKILGQIIVLYLVIFTKLIKLRQTSEGLPLEIGMIIRTNTVFFFFFFHIRWLAL